MSIAKEKINPIFKLSNEKKESYLFCENAPQDSVCMPLGEYRRLLKVDNIENEVLKKKLILAKKKEEFEKDFSFSWQSLALSFLLGMVVGEVVD